MLYRALLVVLCVVNFCFATEQIKYFYSPSCHQCLRVTHELIPVLQQNGYMIERYDLSDVNNYLLLKQYTGDTAVIPPILVAKGKYYSGLRQIRSFTEKQYGVGKGNASKQDVAMYKNMSWGVVTIGGLIDGVNPCAFATIIFLIAFLQYRKYAKCEVVFIGMAFCVAVYITYFLLGVGLLQGLYKFPTFFKVHTIFYRLLALLCLVLAIISFRDAWLIVRKNHSGVILQLPKSIKKLIHKIIRSKL